MHSNSRLTATSCWRSEDCSSSVQVLSFQVKKKSQVLIRTSTKISKSERYLGTIHQSCSYNLSKREKKTPHTTQTADKSEKNHQHQVSDGVFCSCTAEVLKEQREVLKKWAVLPGRWKYAQRLHVLLQALPPQCAQISLSSSHQWRTRCCRTIQEQCHSMEKMSRTIVPCSKTT